MAELVLTWSTSRGRDTYGYNIARLDDTETGKRYRCMGGGYDMVGTVIGEWLQDRYQDRLKGIAHRADRYANGTGPALPDKGLYGMRVRQDGTVSLDGACGESAMWRVAEAIGLTVTARRYMGRSRDNLLYVVTEGTED